MERTDVLPLGSGALAGSSIVLDRELIARELGFAHLSQNSLDAVGDRDFVCEFLFCLAMIGMHLSRLSEDLIIWSTTEFGFVEFSEGFSTGSSLMPQKKNPDMAELTRGKTGRLYGNLMSILTSLKGLPSSYNRDLQEDKEALFDSIDTISAALEVFSSMLPELKINRARMEAAANDPNLLATDLAEYLVRKGIRVRNSTRSRWLTLRNSRRYSISMLLMFSMSVVPSPRVAPLARLRLRMFRPRSNVGANSFADNLPA